MKKPTRKPNKIVAGLQQALMMAREITPVGPVFNAGQVLCIGGRAVVTDYQGRPWLVDADAGTATPVTTASWRVRSE